MSSMSNGRRGRCSEMRITFQWLRTTVDVACGIIIGGLALKKWVLERDVLCRKKLRNRQVNCWVISHQSRVGQPKAIRQLKALN